MKDSDDLVAEGYTGTLRCLKVCRGCARLKVVGYNRARMQCPEETARWEDSWWDSDGFARGHVPKTCPQLALHDVTEALRQL